jgi:hypothetical protein
MGNEHANPTDGSHGAGESRHYEPPTCEVICLACEISAYAPDGDLPLF